MTAFSIGNLILNLALAIGIKYLWNMVNLLQFAIFMRIWKVNIPTTCDIFLKSLKSLALFEFLPTDELDDKVFGWLGIKSDSEDDSDGECVEDCPQSTFDQLAVVLLGASALAFLILILLLLRCLVRTSQKVRGCYEGLK